MRASRQAALNQLATKLSQHAGFPKTLLKMYDSSFRLCSKRRVARGVSLPAFLNVASSISSILDVPKQLGVHCLCF